MAWVVRVINSLTVYMLGSSLYSWFSFYMQDYVETGNYQDWGFYVEQSTDTWVYNLVTKVIMESISLIGEVPLYSQDVWNGYTLSLLAWLHTGTGAIGKRKFPGFYLWDDEQDQDVLSGVLSTYKASLTRLIRCDDQFESALVTCPWEDDHVVLSEPSGIIWAGWNEICELCLYCYVTCYEIMQVTPYSIYDETYQSDLEFMLLKCSFSGPMNILPLL
ncbi:putative 1,3-beta glucanase [Aspergillus novofumigatus IBT 16806]|uniref:Uncharacterized protein n=1 Tax=Aspergillus novofumigatus (strain IBT 16806) TaxID=1392255 RepID=A0A2I1CKU1_ASPN1|nr:uncharacterized protein P174DRAFT_466359 [Aspergillus novofumigatus IBT 16806]PKX98226.1 hypothetical protein P174DRAFT_466359 [Aspergillus novofumigatus IBT 16806]